MNFSFKKIVQKVLGSGEVLNGSLSIKGNPFRECELCDIFFEDITEVKSFLGQIQAIYKSLDSQEKMKPIYLNFSLSNKLGYVSYNPDALALPVPLNGFLTFKNEKELEQSVFKLRKLRN